MDTKRLSKLYKKASKKNFLKHMEERNVLLIKKDELTDYTHLLNNLSDFLYTKRIINLNEVDDKELLNSIKTAKYIFFDSFDPRLSVFDYQNQTTIFVGHQDGYFIHPQRCENDLENYFFSNMHHIIVGSELMKNYYQSRYQLNDAVFLNLGYYLNDKFYSKKWLLESEKIAEGYLDLLYRINVYYLPRDFDADISTELGYLAHQLDDSYNIFYYSHQTYDVDPFKIQKVYQEDIRYMFNNVNVIITDNNPLVFEMANVNQNIKIIQGIEDLETVVEQIKANDFSTNNEMMTKNWYQYDQGVCCRSIVTTLMRLV